MHKYNSNDLFFLKTPIAKELIKMNSYKFIEKYFTGFIRQMETE